MQDLGDRQVNRRGFMATGAAATAAASALAAGSTPALQADEPQPQEKKAQILPKRTLGKTGVEVSMLNLGTWRSPGLDRLLKFAWANGVRYYDTAQSYGSEPAIGKWLTENPEVRKQIFLVTKDHPHEPKQLIEMVDQRLKALKTDYLDLYFFHALGDSQNLDYAMDIARGGEGFKEAIETIKKAGKAKFVGFSTHHTHRAEIIQAAADGGVVDAIMLQYTPWLAKDAPLNRALDACHKKGIGLISMKQVAGQSNVLNEVPKHMPDLKEKGLSPYQALLHAIWSDERISSCCVSMRNTDQVRENSAAAKSYQPMKQADIERLRDACLAAGPTFCADCDGRCAVAGGTKAALGDLTRLLTYHDQYGYGGEARRLYGAMSQSDRDWSGIDFEAAREACPNGLNFAHLLPRVDKHLA
jgi:aryl-alcohol dehydrogenase-like predicted oxidoreductase